MNKQYSNKIEELIGVVIIRKELAKIKEGNFAGSEYYRLFIEHKIERCPWLKKITAFKDRVGTWGSIPAEQIWKDIEESNYAEKRYILYCHKKDELTYTLVSWKELEN